MATEATAVLLESLISPSPSGTGISGVIVESLIAPPIKETAVTAAIIESLIAPGPSGTGISGVIVEVMVAPETSPFRATAVILEALVAPGTTDVTAALIETLVAPFNEMMTKGALIEALVSPFNEMKTRAALIESMVAPNPLIVRNAKFVDLIQTLDLLPATLGDRQGIDPGELVSSPDGAIGWQTAAETSKTTAMGAFAGVHDTWPARATLAAVAGVAVTDAAFDVATNGPRRCEGARLTASGLRAFLAIEIHHEAPEGSSLVYRVRTGGVEYYVTGTSWVVATDPLLHWSTRGQIQSQFVRLSPLGRDINVIAWLQSSDGTQPSFYGYTVAYAVRDFGDEDDAIIRTLRRALLDGLEVSGFARQTIAAGAGAAPISIGGGEFDYDITGVAAVFDLTADPDELVELPGTFAAGTPGSPTTSGPTWTPDTPIADGNIVQIQFCYRPYITVARHRDLVKISRQPSVLLMFGGGTPALLRGQGMAIVRDLDNGGSAVGLPSPARAEQPLDISIIGELSADVRRIESAMRSFLGGNGYLALLSPETGRGVDVREFVAFRTSTALLAQGVHEARAAWVITYQVRGLRSLQPVYLVRQGGALIDI